MLSLLSRVYTELSDWQSVLKLLPSLRQHASNQAELDSLEQFACKSLLEKAASESAQALQQCWKQIPAPASKRPLIIAYYAQQLIACGEGASAEMVLRHQLQKMYDSQLCEIYGRAVSDQPDKQLAFAEKLLKSNPDDGVLLKTLARLSLRVALPEKAKDYYQQCIAVGQDREAFTSWRHCMQSRATSN